MHEFNDAGLENIRLKNGFIKHQTRYGEGLAYQGLTSLTQQVCVALALRPGRLTGTEFRYIRRALELSQSNLGKLFDRTEQTIANWEKNNKVPFESSLLLKQNCVVKFGYPALVSTILTQQGHAEISNAAIVMSFDNETGTWGSNFHIDAATTVSESKTDAWTAQKNHTDVVVLSCHMPIPAQVIENRQDYMLEFDGFEESFNNASLLPNFQRLLSRGYSSGKSKARVVKPQYGAMRK